MAAGDAKGLKQWLDSGGDVHAHDPKRGNLLNIAARRAHLPCVKVGDSPCLFFPA